jgi:hypothetical protein
MVFLICQEQDARDWDENVACLGARQVPSARTVCVVVRTTAGHLSPGVKEAMG